MHLSNQDKALLSYRHNKEIQHVFKNFIKGELCIEHFSINVFFGNGESIFLSPTPNMAEELCKKNFVSFDSNYKSEVYKKYCIYPWQSVASHSIDNVINLIKEEKFNMRNGMMIIRNLGKGRYVMYSFATHKKNSFDGQFYFLFHCKANYIAQMGDYMYNELLSIVNQYSLEQKICMPKIRTSPCINLENNFRNDEQRELFEKIKYQTEQDLLKVINNNKKSSLRLINGGKIAI